MLDVRCWMFDERKAASRAYQTSAIRHPPSAIRHPASQQGFTLLELLVVLIIMALAAALVAPSITKGLEGTRLRGAASDLATFLKHARNLALVRKIVYRVIVVPETQSAWLGALEEEPGQGDKGTRLHPASVAEVFTLPEGVLVKGEGALTFAFFPTGAALGGTVELEGGGRTMKVQVDSVTGLVRVIR